MTGFDDDQQIGYQALPRGVPIVTSDGITIGTVDKVLDNAREHIFDGIVIRTEQGRRFVDAPEVARISLRQVTLTIDAAASGQAPRVPRQLGRDGDSPAAALVEPPRPLTNRRLRRMQRVGVAQFTPGGGLAVDASALQDTRRACRAARAQGRHAGAAGLHDPRGRDVDPSAVVFASRVAGEDWFCFEQPDRDGSALAALGTVTRLTASGADRFKRIARDWRELTAGAVADPPDGPPGAGLVALGGFAFAPEGGHAPHWAGFKSGDLIVPEVALARRKEDVRLTLAALAAPDDVPEEIADAAHATRRRTAAGAAAVARPRAGGPLPHRLGGAARALRGRGRPRRRAHQGRRLREDRARARGHRPGADRARRGGGLRRPAGGL